MIGFRACFLFWLAISLSSYGFGQRLSFGVISGARINGAMDPDAQDRDESRFYTVGPTMELQLPWKLSLEVDALYQRMGSSGGECVFTFCGFSRTRANSWEFPMIAKRRLPIRRAALYGGIGYTPRRVGTAAVQWTQYRTGPISEGETVDYTVHRFVTKSPAELTQGLVATGGIEFRAAKFKVAPEFRYVRWNHRFWEFFGSHGFFTGSSLNQFEFLLGIRR